MEKLKPTLKNMVLVLVGVSVVVGFILAYVNHITEDPIAEKAKATLAQGIKDVMKVDGLQVTADDTVKTEVDGKQLAYVVHKTADKSGKPLGAAVESTTTGFGGDLKVLVGFDNDGKILGYTILETSETPGLGAKADKWFQDAKDGGRAIDVTCGKRTRAVIITDSEHVILSAFQSETISNRLSDEEDDDTGDSEEEDE